MILESLCKLRLFLFALRKVGIILLSLTVVATLTFFMMHAVPGDPFLQETSIPQEILDALYRYYGLDEPLWKQYLSYMAGLLQGDLGPSFKFQGRSVNAIIKEGFPVSMMLGIEALIFSLISGVTLGSIAAAFHQKWQDRFVMLIAVLGVSVPSFILATFLQYILAMRLDLLPVARWGSFSQTILPMLSLAALPTAFIARLARSSLIEVSSQDFLMTAKAKGLGPLRIFYKHQLKNALLPVITYLGPLAAHILTGSFAVEKIFGIPGLGQWFVLSITNRDYTVIMGITIFYSFLLMLCVFFVDLIYLWIDPRIRLEKN